MEKLSVAGFITLATLLLVPLSACQSPIPGVTEDAPASLLFQVTRISLEDLLDGMENNANLLVVDTRTVEEYNIDHIKGAVSAPLQTILDEEWMPPPFKVVVLYCA